MEGLPAGYSQSDIMAALAAASQKPKAPTLSFADVQQDDLVTPGSFDGVSINTRKLICPRDGCGTTIIGAKTASWVDCAGEIVSKHSSSPSPVPMPP